MDVVMDVAQRIESHLRSSTDEITCLIQGVENVEDFGELCMRPKKAYAFSGFQEYQCAVRPFY